jgi:hypothetical protein
LFFRIQHKNPIVVESPFERDPIISVPIEPDVRRLFWADSHGGDVEGVDGGLLVSQCIVGIAQLSLEVKDPLLDLGQEIRIGGRCSVHDGNWNWGKIEEMSRDKKRVIRRIYEDVFFTVGHVAGQYIPRSFLGFYQRLNFY